VDGLGSFHSSHLMLSRQLGADLTTLGAADSSLEDIQLCAADPQVENLTNSE
jgi:hypothetical protein